MAFFNIAVGCIAGALILLFLLIAQQKKLKWIVFIIAMLAIPLGMFLSNMYLYPQYLAWKFEKTILQQPLFALIAKQHPQVFTQYMHKVKISMEKNQDNELVPAYTADLVNTIFDQHLQTAPDESIYIYLKATLDLYRYLYTQNPQAVLKLEKGSNDVPVDFNKIWEDKTFQLLLSHVLDAKKLIIEASVQSPVQATPDEKSVPLLNNVIDELVKKYGAQIVKAVFATGNIPVPPQIGAAVIMEFYAGVASQGKENAGIIMRYIAKEKLKKIEVAPAKP